jgi:CTP synthase
MKHKHKQNKKYIFVVGGVISGVGKGITTSSIGKILQARGFNITAIKIDPYVNVDAGTMNPTEHGEVFVLKDGDETDQDMGNYERFLSTTLTKLNYMTTGRVYRTVIENERNLKYKGRCVQVVPHIPQEVVSRIKKASSKAGADITVVEIGGTVGEYENILFLESIRMLKAECPGDVAVIMVSYLPTPPKVGEMKTKPTQHATRLLNGAGIRPNVIIARSEIPLDKKRKDKISLFCNVGSRHVISAPDVESIYDIPINFEKDKLGDIILEELNIDFRKKKTDLIKWRKFVSRIKKLKNEVHIAIIGKYFDTGNFVLSDSYISIIEAVKYSAYSVGKKPVIHWLSASKFEDKKNLKSLNKYDGILVPGGFGERGIDGKLNVIKYAREHKIPYFGICYGMQLMVVEFARNILGMKSANTKEVNPKARDLVIDIMDEQREKLDKKDYGGSMRLGSYTAILSKDTIARGAYGKRRIEERHRHRYEVNPKYIDVLQDSGLIFSGKSPNGMLMEIAELPRNEHPFFLGTQFHPEFQAYPYNPHPIFTEFIKASSTRHKQIDNYNKQQKKISIAKESSPSEKNKNTPKTIKVKNKIKKVLKVKKVSRETTKKKQEEKTRSKKKVSKIKK